MNEKYFHLVRVPILYVNVSPEYTEVGGTGDEVGRDKDQGLNC